MQKIVVINKTKGNWSREEIGALVGLGVDVTSLGKMPATLTVAPVKSQEAIAAKLGHSDFTYEVVDYSKRPF